MVMSGWSCISAETGISLHLLRTQKRGGGQMIFEMGFSEFALRASDGGGGGPETFRSHGSRGELSVQLPFLFDQLGPQRN